MKKLAFAIIGGICLTTACQNSAEISGTLTGVESDTLVVISYISGEDKAITDTIPMKNGTFAFNIGDSVLKQVYIYDKPSTDSQKNPALMKSISFMLVPEQPVKITGSFDDYKLEGSKFYEDYSLVIDKFKPCMHKLDSLTSVCIALEEKIGTDGITADSIRKVYSPARDWVNEINEIKKDFIRNNPDNDLSVYLLSITSLETIKEYNDSLTDRVKQGTMAPLYQWMKTLTEKEDSRNKAQEAMSPGAMAPDFTVKDLDGKDFTLSSLKGKYVVLDFWGSWCGWCIKGIPEMKKYYNKYKDKIEFVGIDCNDTEEAWKKAVEEHQLPWINVRNNGDPDVSIMYGISGYPTKFIIDPEGKINKRVIGEDPEFYTYLDSLMK